MFGFRQLSFRLVIDPYEIPIFYRQLWLQEPLFDCKFSLNRSCCNNSNSIFKSPR